MTESNQAKIDCIAVERDNSGIEWNILQHLIAGDISQPVRESDGLHQIEALLISEKLEVNSLTTSSQNLLHLLCLRPLNKCQFDRVGNYEIAKLLIENEVDINQKDERGKTPLMIACQNGYMSVVDALVRLKWMDLDVSVRDSSGESAFTIAGRTEDNYFNAQLITTLFWQAVVTGDMNTVTRFRNSSTKECSIRFDDLCINSIKLRFPIDLSVFKLENDNIFERPLTSCITFHAWLNAVIIADINRNESMLELLFDFEKIVRATTRSGLSALHLVLSHCKSDYRLNRIFEILVDSGRFEVNDLTNEKETVLHVTCRCGDSEKFESIIDLLFRNKVNVNQRNIFGETALMIACKNENTVAVRVLLLKWKEDYGEKLDIEARDNKGQTALSIAQQLNNKEIEAMIKQKYFLRAVESGDTETVKTYMKRSNENGQTEENQMKRLSAGILQKPPSNKYDSQSETWQGETRSETIADLSNMNEVTPLTDDTVVDEYRVNIERDEVQSIAANSITQSVFLEGIYMAYCKSEKDNSRNDILKLLLNDKHYMHEPNEEGQTILHSAVEEYLENKCEPKGLRKIEILLKFCKCNVSALNSQNETVLHLVCCRKANENLLLDDLLKILLECRVDLNLRNNSEKTALLIACENGNTKIVRNLLTLTRNNDIYIDVVAYDNPDADETVNDNRRFDQMSRVSNMNLREMKWIQTYYFHFDTWREAAIVAIDNSYEEILKLLLDYDVVVQRQYGDEGSTILTHCFLDETSSAEASLKLCKKLLESGNVNVNALDCLSCTALHKAFADADNQNFISLLLPHGINVNLKEFLGKTPILYGIIDRDSSAAREILNFAKATGTWLDIDAKDASGRTALMWASLWKRSDGVRMLLNAKASVNLTDNRGFTAMHHALHEVISRETWINYGDFPRNIQELNQRKAIDVILYKTEPHEDLDVNVTELNEEKIKIVELLLESDLDVNSLDCEEYSPMDIVVATIPEIPSRIKDMLKAKEAILNVFQNKNKDSEGQVNLNVNSNLLHRRANLLKFCTQWNKDHHQFYMLKGESDKLAKEKFSKLSANIKTQLISARDQKRRTPLHRAIISGQRISRKNVIIESEVINVVKLLISFGCSANETDTYGRTPLHYADFKKLKNLLISHGADKTVKDENGIEAIEMANLLIAAAGIGRDRVLRIIQEINKCVEEPKSIYLQREKIEMLHCNIEWKKNFNPETIPKLVWEEGNYAFRHPSVNEFREEVKAFIENLASEITKRDSRFAVDPILVGSSYEETKLDLPDEFDFLFVLKTFGQLCEVTLSPELPSGFVRLKRKQSENNCMTNKDFDRFFDNKFMLITEKLKEQFQIILRNVLADAQFLEKNSNFDWDLDLQAGDVISLGCLKELAKTTLNLRNTKLDFENRNVFHVSIDIVPSIHIDGWWPDEAISNVSEEIKAFGCILVYDWPRRLYPSVPNSESCVKISFARAESEVIKRSSDAAKQAYMIAKQLINKSGYDYLGCGTSYTLKTSFLYCIEAFAPTSEKVSELRMSQDAWESKLQYCTALKLQPSRQLWLENLMKCHLDFDSQGFCPCYFMPNFPIPVKGRLKAFHMRCLTDDAFALGLSDGFFWAYRLYRSVSLHASGFDFQLPPPNPVFEHFDREAMIANLRSSASENFVNVQDIYVANETEQVEVADDD